MASKTDSTRVMWRVQTKAKSGNWVNRGLYETRDAARLKCAQLRGTGFIRGVTIGRVAYRRWNPDASPAGYGFGNTRVVRHVRGGGR